MSEYKPLSTSGILPPVRAESGGGDDVVAASMADTGQGVVLGQEGQGRPARPLPGPEGGFESGQRAGDIETLRGQELAAPGCGLPLLEAEFGIGVDPVTEVG